MKVPFEFIQKMCQALSSSIQVLIREDKLNPSMDFKKYFCLWKAKLERDYSFRVQFDKITVCLACIWCSSRCLMRVPPTLWTMHFGLPVVPDEYMINSGWSNETCKKAWTNLLQYSSIRVLINFKIQVPHQILGAILTTDEKWPLRILKNHN